jgi:hypothetical protein
LVSLPLLSFESGYAQNTPNVTASDSGHENVPSVNRT